MRLHGNLNVALRRSPPEAGNYTGIIGIFSRLLPVRDQSAVLLASHTRIRRFCKSVSFPYPDPGHGYTVVKSPS